MRVVEPAMGEASQVLVEDPELAGDLEGERLAAAVRECVARTIHLPAGPWAPNDDTGEAGFGTGLLILNGLVVRRVGVAGRFGAELLGDGDLLSPWRHEDIGATLPRTSQWQVLRASRMAVLDGDFVIRLTRYPEVISVLFARALRRSRYLAVNMAIVQQPRIDLRLQMLFWELADRWGIVRQCGVHLPLHLTHSMLADLVAARRPTVTKALGELAERSSVIWTGEAWLLSGGPPAEMESAGVVAAIANASQPAAAAEDGDGASR
jgi:CRP/FNR family cyclic AMP-dependent transcriptional regulator